MAGSLPLSKVATQAVAGRGSLPRPLQATLKVTGRCNSRCAYCTYGNPDMQHPDVPFDRLYTVIEDLAKLGVRSLCLSGGEPLLHPGLVQIIQAAVSLGMVVTITTNGTLLDLATAQRLHTAGLSTLVLSFDSFENELYQQIRGIPINKAWQHFRELQAYRRRAMCIPRVVVNIVLTRLILDRLLAHIEALCQWLLPEDRIMVQAYQPSPNLSPSEDPFRFMPSDRARLEELCQSLITAQKRGIPIGNDATFLVRLPAFLAEGQMPVGYQCTIGYFTLYIKENLDVHPCWQLPPVGNLNHTTIAQLWHSPEYARARTRMLALNCRRCALVCHSPEFLDTLAGLVSYEPF